MAEEEGEEVIFTPQDPRVAELQDRRSELRVAAGDLRTAFEAVVEAAGKAMDGLHPEKGLSSGVGGRAAREPMEEHLRRRLQRIAAEGAMAVLEDKEDFCSLADAGAENAQETVRVEFVMKEVDRVACLLDDLMGNIHGLRDNIRHSQDKARSKLVEFSLCTGQAHIPDASSVNDGVLLKHWSQPNGILPEYRRAAELICVRCEWMCSTLLGRYAGKMRAEFAQDVERFDKDISGSLRGDIFVKLIKKAYHLQDDVAAKEQKDLLSDQNVMQKVLEVYESMEPWKKPLFVVACKVVVDLEEDRAAIVSKLSEVVDHALHCHQVKVKGFQVVMSHSARLLERKARREVVGQEDEDVRDLDEALLCFYACFQDFLDDHKERAFNASFLEPALFYCSHSDQGQHLQDNTVPHALNWYVALLNAALGAHLPFAAHYDDDAMCFVVDFWLALKDECWQHFSDPECFGRSWQGIPALARGGKSLIRKKVRPGHLPHDKDVGCGKAKIFANAAVDPTGDVGVRRVLSLYLERFAHFFSRDFFIRRAFEVLNSENKPEHVGFRKACATLYEQYRRENANISEETLVEHVYPDDPYFTKLDIERTESFLFWLQVVKVPHGGPAAADAEEDAASSKRARFMYRSFDEGVTSLMGMGFDEDAAKEAWLACLGTMEAAVGVLMGDGPPPHGLPEGEEPPAPPGQPQCPQQ